MNTIKNLVNINMLVVAILFIVGFTGSDLDDTWTMIFGLTQLTCAIWLAVLANKKQ